MYANLGLSGGGNFAVANNVMMFLQRQPHFRPEHTRVLFNISDMARVDVMCEADDVTGSANFPWSSVLGVNWRTHGCRPVKHLKRMGIPPAEWTNELALMGMISYLELRGFDYHFMYMLEHTARNLSPWFQDFMNTRAHRRVDLEGHGGMMEYCRSNNLVTDQDNWHPSIQGHGVISQLVKKHLGVPNT
jgi:hypothetical protein